MMVKGNKGCGFVCAIHDHVRSLIIVNIGINFFFLPQSQTNECPYPPPPPPPPPRNLVKGLQTRLKEGKLRRLSCKPLQCVCLSGGLPHVLLSSYPPMCVFYYVQEVFEGGSREVSLGDENGAGTRKISWRMGYDGSQKVFQLFDSTQDRKRVEKVRRREWRVFHKSIILRNWKQDLPSIETRRPRPERIGLYYAPGGRNNLFCQGGSK